MSNPTDFSNRIGDLCRTAIATLMEQYNIIGISTDEQSVLLVALESELQLTCQKRIDEATENIQLLKQSCQEQAVHMNHMRRQLGMGEIVEDATVTLTLQELQRQRECEMTQLQELKTLHLTSLNGDMERLHALYTRLGVSVEEVIEFMEPVDESQSDLSFARIHSVEQEIIRMEKLLETRNNEITGLISEMSAVWTRIGYTQADVTTEFDHKLFASSIDSSSPIDPIPSVIQKLESRKQGLQEVESKRSKEIAEKRAHIAALHKKINATPDTIKQHESACAFHTASAHPLSLNVLKFYSSECDRLELMKAQKMQSLVFEVRIKLNDVYQSLHLTQSEISLFKPLQSTVYTDAVLEAHENELARASARLAALSVVFKEVSKWTAMKAELEEFETSSADPKRFQQRNAHLILKQEEKLRKKRDTVFPVLELKLVELLDQFQSDHPEEGPVRIDGVDIAEQVRANIQSREEKAAAGKKSRSTIDTGSVKVSATPAKSRPASAATPLATPAKATISVAPTPSAHDRHASVPATPRNAIAATPIKKNASVCVIPLSAVPATPVAVPSTPSDVTTPLVRGPVSRIPTFGTTASFLHSTTTTPARSNSNIAHSMTATPVRQVLGEISQRLANEQPEVIIEESPQKITPIPVEEEANRVNDPSNDDTLSPYMARFLAALSHLSSESEQLELFLGPMGFGGKPTKQDEAILYKERAKLYESFGEKEVAAQDMKHFNEWNNKHEQEN